MSEKKIIEIEITQKMCDEMNDLAIELGLDKFPDYKKHEPHKLRCLFG